MFLRKCALSLAALVVFGCGEDDPVPTNSNNGSETNNSASNNSNNGSTNNQSLGESNNATNTNGETNSNNESCPEPENYYRPDEQDSWAECVSDAGDYVQFEASISTAARVAAFEAIGDLLWRNEAPSVEDFASAYEEYSVAEGLLSRVSRREDEHYPPVTNDAGDTLSCRDEGVPAMDPERCVGPAVMVPMLNDAFEAGLEGTDPLIQAKKIEATLLWFLYISTFKEAVTCGNVLKDCDSSYAYYTGGFQRDGGIGLAAYYKRILPEAHDEVFDSILGVRCWRDIDSAIPPEDSQLQVLSLTNLDSALLWGFAALVLDRIETWENAEGELKVAEWEALKILGPVLAREAELRRVGAGDLIVTEFAKSAEEFDTQTARTLISELFQCLN